METEKMVPQSTPTVKSETSGTTKGFKDLRSRLNLMLDEIAEGPEGASSLAAVRCGGGCHQGVID